MNEPIFKLLDDLRNEYRELKEEKTRISLNVGDIQYYKREFKYLDGKCVILAGVISDLTQALAESARGINDR